MTRLGGGDRSARAVALHALERVAQGAYAHLVVPALLRDAGLDARDRAFATDLAYGTVRERARLDHLIEPALDRSLASLEVPVREGLRLGTYQLVHGVAPHAAVAETVEAVAQRRPRARGLVNAVLRRVASAGPPWVWPTGDDAAAVAVRTSHPRWMVERLVADLGAPDALAVLAADTEPAALTLRPNPMRTDSDSLARELVAAGARVERGAVVPEALLVHGAGDPGALPAVAEGRATPQDQGSQAVVELLAPAAGDTVAEVGAAPGGKVTAIAERVGRRGRVVAVDRRRLGLVAAAAARLGVEVQCVAADGRALPLRSGSCDRVLVDAPCSGLGVLRRRPEARWRVRPDAPATLATVQRSLLAAAADAVRPGGRLVYSVCTLTRVETRAVDDWAAAALGAFEAAPLPRPPWRAWGRGALLLPHVAGSDGMYALVLDRRDSTGR